MRSLPARLLLVLVALLVGGAVWGAATIQRRAADKGRQREAASQGLLTGMLDMETGMRGFVITGQEDFLEPWRLGSAGYRAAFGRLDGDLGAAAERRLRTADALARAWQRSAASVIDAVRREGPRAKAAVTGALGRKRVFDRFRADQRALAAQLESDRKDAAAQAGYASAGVALLLALLLGIAGAVFFTRRERAAREQRLEDRRYRESQGEFAETMQVAESENEAHELLRRHLERSVPSSQVVVLNRNNSADRLEASTRVAEPTIAEGLQGATPRSCLAVRLGREHAREGGGEPLMSCEICGRTPGGAVCRPLLVGSEVIGSVLVTHHQPLRERDQTRLADSVQQAAPVLANLRNLAIAETRAATDLLTGLANRRSIEDTLKRMVAQASRSVQPLSALLLGLDHFKRINDLHGHERGDEALALVGMLLRDVLRDSDFAGRYGGEEFIVLAPGTDSDGAATLAENLRSAVAELHLASLDEGMTVSVGVATFPVAAPDAAGLVRMADRALYAAKQAGRNRVEVASRVRSESASD